MAGASSDPPPIDAIPAGNHYAPTTARGRATRQRLLDAAIAEFGEKGFHAASVSAITTRAGIGQGTFYIYFASKDACYAVATEATSRALRRALLRGFGSLSLVDNLRASFDAYFAFCAEQRMAMRALDEASFVAPDIWRAHMERLVHSYADLLDRYARQRGARTDRDFEALGIVGALQSAARLVAERLDGGDESAARDGADALAAMLLSGLGEAA